MFGSIPLQTAKVIRIPKLGPQLLENVPVFLYPRRADFAGKVALQICSHGVVIQKRVVHVEQEYDAIGRLFVFVHFSTAPSVALLIAEMLRVCHVKMQPVGLQPFNGTDPMAVTPANRSPDSKAPATLRLIRAWSRQSVP